MEKINELTSIKHDFIEWFKRDARECCGLDDEVALKVAGDVADIIKDLASAEKDCMEAAYYRTVIEAMDEGEEPRMGYNSNRYKNGHYAPKGHGNMSGYRPFKDQEPYIDAYLHNPDFRKEMMGYSGQNGKGANQSDWNGHSATYNDYLSAKRYYTETSSKEAKDMMDSTGDRHVEEALETIKEIYMSADPDHKKRLKMELTKVVGEMPI